MPRALVDTTVLFAAAYRRDGAHVDSLTTDTFATAKALFRQYERFSFVDVRIVAYM